MTIDTTSRMRFMANNFLDTGYNSLSISSVASGYYASDLTSLERSRVVKFAGRFLIEAGVNDKLYFNASTYTIPAGDYASPMLLVAAINPVISPILCSYDATLMKFYFVHLSSSFTIKTSLTTNSAWETMGFITGTDTNVLEDEMRYSDGPRVHWPCEIISGDFGYQAQIGFIGIIGDLTRELRIPEGAVVTFEANTVNDFTSPLVSKVLTWTKTGLFTFLDDVSGSAWRYWRIKFTHPDGPFFSEIGYLYVGDYSTFTDRNISVGIDIGYVDPSISSAAEDGQEFFNQKTPYRVFNGLSVGVATPENVTYLKRLYALKQKVIPFFAALDPKVKISSSIEEMTIFCKFSREISGRHQLYKYYDLGFELKEVM